MQQYKIRPGGFKEIQKQALFKVIPIMLIAATAGIVISMVNSKDTDFSILPIIIPVTALSIGVGLYLGLNRQRTLFRTFTVTISNNLITREQSNTPTVSIYFNDIQEVVKSKNGSFVIRGKDATDIILVPAQIENYDEFEETLNNIHAIANKSSTSFIQKFKGLLSLLTVGLMLCVYTATNKIVIAISGTAFIVIMSWSFCEIRRSKNIDHKTKQKFWWVLLVVASIIGMMILKLTAPPSSP